MTIEEVRSEFPHIRQGKIYFNHAAIGPVPNSVKEKVNEYLDVRNSGAINNYMQSLQTAAQTKHILAKSLGVKANRIGFVPNIAYGMNLLSQGLDLNEGDKVILNDIEFPSNVYPFLNLREKGVEVEFVPSKDGLIDPSAIFEKVDKRTKLISLSAVQFVSGFRSDLETIGSYCSERGIIFAVDAMQAAGAVTIDIAKCKIEFLTGAAQKWFCALQGFGFVYVSDNLQQRIRQKDVGWNSYKSAWELLNYDTELKSDAERFQIGTMNQTGLIAFNAALKLFGKFGFENIEQRVIRNSVYLIEKLTSVGLTPVLKNLPEKNIGGIVSCKTERAQYLKEELQKKNIIVEVREGYLRISPHFYNTFEEIDNFTAELSKLI